MIQERKNGLLAMTSGATRIGLTHDQKQDWMQNFNAYSAASNIVER